MFRVWILLLLLINFSACNKVESPQNLTPTLILSDVKDITRTTVRLCCEVKINGTEIVSELQCYYGTSMAMENVMECDPSLSNVSISLSDLKAGTVYYYCFEAGNGVDKVRSTINSFQTNPVEVPTVGELQLLGKGPTSVMLQFELKDDGGNSLCDAGFYVCSEKEKIRVGSVKLQNGLFYDRLVDLQQYTDYIIQGFAVNDVGETKTQEIHIRTGETVMVGVAGSLRELVSDKECFNITQLSVSGYLNGTDFRFLREMMGRDESGKQTEGKMNMLDLTDAMIVSGGESFDGAHYTKQNIVSSGLFADCFFLETIKLPYGTIEIEGGAFDNCSELDSLYIPETVMNVTPSKGCCQLEYITVPENHVRFASFDGDLYSKDFSTLYWYPMGKIKEPVSFHEKINKIEAYAFQQLQLEKIELPLTIQDLGVGAFYAAKIKEIILPEGITYIPTALFQDCNNLTVVHVGKETSFLSAYCFDGCPLQHLFVPINDFLPICHPETFKGMEHLFSDCVLHVPKGYEKIYKHEAPWKNFKSIIGDID